MAVFVAMTEVAGMVRYSHGLWHVDDVAALMALVKGCSEVIHWTRWLRLPTWGHSP